MKIKIDENSLSNVNTSLSAHYLIYRIVNDINGMHYIGQHKTCYPLDSYSGSGYYLGSAQAKYGLSNFTKFILFDYDNFEDMNNKEQELVQLSDCYPYDEMSYNIREGGSNGTISEETSKKMVETRMQNNSYASERNGMYGRHLSDFMELDAYEDLIKRHAKSARERASDEEWLKKMSEVTSGERNGMYGKHLKDLMDPDAYARMCENHAHFGEDNPMFGKSSWENCTPEQRTARIEKFRASIKGKNKGRMKVVNKETGKIRLVKPDELESFLAAGYVLPPKNRRYR